MFIEIDNNYAKIKERLIETAFNHILNTDDKICICSYRVELSKNIKNSILDKIKLDSRFSSKDYDYYSKKIVTTIPSFLHFSINNFKVGYCYFFEFNDYVGNIINKLSLNKSNIIINSYYTTTISDKDPIHIKNFIKYLCKHNKSNIIRKYKINRLLNEEESFYSFLNKEENFRIDEKLLNVNEC